MLSNQYINQQQIGYAGNMMGSHRFQVNKLFLQETGTYNAMYNRPYEVNTQGGALENAISRLEAAKGELHGGGLAGIGSMLLRPTVNVTQGVSDIYIPNGWSTRRLRFVLEIEVTSRTGSTSIYYFQGFSEFVGVSMQGSIDPRMKFFINSFIRVGRFQVPTATGLAYKDVVQESAQVLNGQLLYQNNLEVRRLRPCDVFAGIQVNHLSAATYGDVIDTRVGIENGTMSFGSQRANNLPTNYLAKFMTGFKDASNLAAFGTGNEGILSRAQCTTMANESEPGENPVLRAFANIQGITQTVDFSMSDLTQLDPEAPRRTVYNPISQIAYGTLHSTGQSENWSSTRPETQFAAQLANTIPALMMESFISELHFTASNMMGMNQSVCMETHAKALTGADMSGHIALLMRRIQYEVLFDLSYGNQDVYDLIMSVDVFGETRIEVSMYGKSHVLYAVPSFGDGLLAPVYTRGEQQYQQLTNDMEIVTNYIKEATVPSNAINSIV